MSKNIYTLLEFKNNEEYIYSSEIINEAKSIFDEVPLKSIGIRPLIIAQNVFEEALAISTTEDSSLTKKEAKKIELSEEHAARLLKYRQNKKMSGSKKYDHLEFENIRDVENKICGISFKDLNNKLICDLHYDLTIGMDEYCKEKGVSNYHSGELRTSNRVKVGRVRQYVPPKSEDIEKLLKTLFQDFSKRKNITLCNILEFHVLFYAIHPFQNGNKRVVRILESMLLDYYGYSAGRSISIAIYYNDEKDACNLFLMESLLRKDVIPFINFAIRGYFYAGYKLFEKMSALFFENLQDNLNRHIQNKFKRSIHLKNYKKGVKVIMSLKGVFRHVDFIKLMKKKGITLGVSQTILQKFLKTNIIKKDKKIYYFEKALEIQKSFKSITAFLLKYNIDVELE